ncbi:MAG: MFS transporter [Bacillota bacterium]|nr:MFS transporter [Bacillota bacterium]
MSEKKTNNNQLVCAILSLSLLTVMAGAAVAPALNVISGHFSTVDPLFIQMIVSVPALFIVVTNLAFPLFCQKIKTKALVSIGLVLYTFGGCVAGLVDNIFFVLISRALVGIGVGIIMPLSTGLLSYHFHHDKQEKLMGYSSAMNQMGGVIATLLAGLLAHISWRTSFLVYLMGLFSLILCLLFIPNERLHSEKTKVSGNAFKKNFLFILAIFLLMVTFFIYPTNYAMETMKDGTIPLSLVAIIMAGMDLIAFFGGLAFVHINRVFKEKAKYTAPVLFLVGYGFMALSGGWFGNILGSAIIGFANGAGVPYIMSAASKKEGKMAAVTVMPLISAALYLAQFLTPLIVSAITWLLGGFHIPHLPYFIAMGSGILMLLTIWRIRE